MNAQNAEGYHFAELAARHFEDVITDGFFADEIIVDPDCDDDGNPYLMVQTTPERAKDLSARFQDALWMTEGGKTHEVALIIKSFKPREAMN